MGRKPTFDPVTTLRPILSRLKKGEPLAIICREEGMPDPSTIWDWAQKSETIAQDIAGAREIGHDAIAANTRLTAKGVEGYSSGDVQRDKLIVETDLKLLAKWDKRYGERTTHEIEGRLETLGSLADHEAAAKLAAILEAVQRRVKGDT